MINCKAFVTSLLVVSILLPIIGFSALTVVSVGDDTLCATPYLTPMKRPNAALFQGFLKSHLSMSTVYESRLDKSIEPSACTLKPGKVSPHFVHSLKSVPSFFVFDASQQSLVWLKKNIHVFQKDNSKGFLVSGTLHEAEILTRMYKLPIMPVSCEGLNAVVKTKHIPLFVKSGWVTQ